MKVQAKFKKTIEVTPMQESLLNFFDNEDKNTESKVESLEWCFEAAAFGYECATADKQKNCLFDLYELNKILKGISMGY